MNKVKLPNSEKDKFRIKGKKAEDFLHSLASKSFFTDWCYPNPILSDGKELCDLLVIFDEVAIIWQVKNLKLQPNGKYNANEVKQNIRQLSGARRRLFDLKKDVTLTNPRRGKERFNPKSIKTIYLISALLGEGEDVFGFVEEYKGNSVHIFTKEFTEIALNELDTIKDFTYYLGEKEKLLRRDSKITILGGEQELLGYFLMNGRSFSKLYEADNLLLQEGIWNGFVNKPEYKRRQKADEISYGWDSIINRAHLSDTPEYELVARELARPNRFQRRYLAKAFLDAHILAHQDEQFDMQRRLVQGEDATYCFLFMDDPEPRERRKAILGTMCFIARGVVKNQPNVIGIATEKKLRPICSYDFCYLFLPKWRERQQREMEKIQAQSGIFKNPKSFRVSED